MDEKQMKQIVDETWNFLNNKGVNFICYMWDKEGEHGGGCQSAGADAGDAMVAIERIVERFNLKPTELFAALEGGRREMERN